jgi:hypothetical protein
VDWEISSEQGINRASSLSLVKIFSPLCSIQNRLTFGLAVSHSSKNWEIAGYARSALDCLALEFSSEANGKS